MKLTLALIFAARTFAATIAAGPATVDFDTAQSNVGFTLPGSVHTVHGAFKLKGGSLHFDPSTGDASGTLVVDAASGGSGSHARDRRMHKDILESARFPEITFAPDHFHGRLAPEGDSEIEMHGIFTIHGAAHEMTLKAQVHVAGDQLTAHAHFTIPYAQWGMKNPSTLFLRVSDKVQIDLTAAGTLRPPATAETRSTR